jgi:hypothetical protein
LGAKLLSLFFAMRSERCDRNGITLSDGGCVPYHRDSKRDYVSIFGKVVIRRPYFYKAGHGGHSPLDAELSLGEDSHSDLVREISAYLNVDGIYHKTGEFLGRLLGLALSTRTMQEVIAEDASSVVDYYAQKPAPDPTSEAEILVVQADGKGVPMVLDTPAEAKPRLGKGEKRGRKKEAVVTTLYTIAPAPRTPQAVVDSLFDGRAGDASASSTPRSGPQNKHIWATLEGKDTALMRLAQNVSSREGVHIRARVALCDGCEALQTRLAQFCPDFTQVLDLIHANEYLWDVANSLWGETNPERLTWMRQHTLQMLSGQTQQLIDEFRQQAEQPQTTATQRTQLLKTANYFERNLPVMDYPTYLERGWPIASGVIEGACRHFVKDRCELSGMRWTQDGAEHLLRLRAVAENGDWEIYHSFRKQQRHTRLYAIPFPGSTNLEIQSLVA